jgi:hypothetical protein
MEYTQLPKPVPASEALKGASINIEVPNCASDTLERFAIACKVGADLRVRPGSGLQATTGGQTRRSAPTLICKPL